MADINQNQEFPGRELSPKEARDLFINSLRFSVQTKRLPDIPGLWPAIEKHLPRYDVWDLQQLRDGLLDYSKEISKSIDILRRQMSENPYKRYSEFCYHAYHALGVLQEYLDEKIDRLTMPDTDEWKDGGGPEDPPKGH